MSKSVNDKEFSVTVFSPNKHRYPGDKSGQIFGVFLRWVVKSSMAPIERHLFHHPKHSLRRDVVLSTILLLTYFPLHRVWSRSRSPPPTFQCLSSFGRSEEYETATSRKMGGGCCCQMSATSEQRKFCSLCGWSAKASSKPCHARYRREGRMPRPIHFLAFLPSLSPPLHQFGNSWSVVFLPNGPR